jgi:hypothetical protein
VWYLDGGGGCRGVEVVGEGGGEAHRGQYGDPERCHRVGAVPKGVHPVAAPLPPLPRRSSRDRRACPSAAAPFPSSCRGGAGDFTAVSFSLSSFSREVLTEEREVSPCRSSLLGWDPPVGESRESDMARANWSTHVTERGLASQETQEAGCTWANKWAYSGPFVRVDPGGLHKLPLGNRRPGLARVNATQPRRETLT